jgi:putative DNA primase/helicase
MLLGSAITPAVIESSGIESREDGLYFPWSDGVGPTVWQARPDNPRTAPESGKPIKYEFPKGSRVPLNRLRDSDDPADFSSVIVAEGTKQQYAVLSHAPGNFAVYGMSGCWGFMHADLSALGDRDVYLLLDADFESNADVWLAAEKFTKLAKRSGAKSVRYVGTTGTGKQGVDDVLAALPEDKRGHSLRTWLATAADKLGRRPKAKAAEMDETDTEAATLFVKIDGKLSYQPVTAAKKLMDRAPAAITAERNIAMYRDGVYGVHSDDVLAAVVGLLGNFYTPGHFNSTRDALIGQLHAEGKRLPECMSEPLLNCPNGMVDLRTGELLPHDPGYFSHVQVTTEYLPSVATPVYDAWLRQALRQEGHTDADVEALVADLEETAGTMLDPSITPSKALFLFGPSRSGKSTFLRLMKAVAGMPNTSAVTLHELGSDQFATANLYGKMLNVAADLSSAHVADLSKFKMATGEDPLHANRKYGQQFGFTNQAMFAFSANELPTVSEASRAYAERMKPFNFPNTFAGREDKTLEAKLMAELPGILARWVAAYGRYLARGGYAPTDAVTQAMFEAKSDRVVQFFQDMCTLTEAAHGSRLTDRQATGRRDVAVAFNAWAERNGGSKMGERAFFQRFAQIAGVNDVKIGPKDRRGFNVVVARSDEDEWNEPDTGATSRTEPQLDPIPASEAAQEDPWTAYMAASEACPVPAALDAASEPQAAVQRLGASDPFAVPGLNYDI